MTDRELLQMALDALEDFRGEYGWLPKQEKAWETLRARLTQPEQAYKFADAMMKAREKNNG